MGRSRALLDDGGASPYASVHPNPPPASWRRPEALGGLVFSVCVTLAVMSGRNLSGPWGEAVRTGNAPAAEAARQQGRAGQRAQVPAPSVVESVADWRRHPGSAFRTRRSRCTLLSDGTVRTTPPPPGDPPFLFDLRNSSLPTKKAACRHCGHASCETGLEQLPQLCCGVCQFEQRFCDQHHPGRNVSAEAAARFAAQGRVLAAFTPCELFARIRGRTLWLLGDSQTWHFYYALECFMREFALSLRRSPPLRDPALIDRLTTTTLARCDRPFPVPPVCLQLAHGTRVCVVRVDFARDLRLRVLPTLMEHSPGFRDDLVVMSTGLHYYNDVDCSESACEVPGNGSLYLRDLEKLAAWRDRRAGRLPATVWMDTPPQHFPGTGYWTGSFRADACEPLDAWRRGEAVARAGGTWNAAAAPLVHRLADAQLRTWAASAELWDSHVQGECTHWCSPGAYHIWLFLLNDVLRDARLGSPALVQQRGWQP